MDSVESERKHVPGYFNPEVVGKEPKDGYFAFTHSFATIEEIIYEFENFCKAEYENSIVIQIMSRESYNHYQYAFRSVCSSCSLDLVKKFYEYLENRLIKYHEQNDEQNDEQQFCRKHPFIELFDIPEHNLFAPRMYNAKREVLEWLDEMANKCDKKINWFVSNCVSIPMYGNTLFANVLIYGNKEVLDFLLQKYKEDELNMYSGKIFSDEKSEMMRFTCDEMEEKIYLSLTSGTLEIIKYVYGICVRNNFISKKVYNFEYSDDWSSWGSSIKTSPFESVIRAEKKDIAYWIIEEHTKDLTKDLTKDFIKEEFYYFEDDTSELCEQIKKDFNLQIKY